MAIESISLMLRAGFRQHRDVTPADFIDRLGILANDPYEKLSASPGQRSNGLVNFFVIEMAAFQSQADPWDAFASSLATRLKEIAIWLNARPSDSIRACQQNGLIVALVFDIWMDADQLDVELPPEVLGACSRLALPIVIQSND